MEILRKLAQLAETDRTAIVYGDGTLSYRTLDHWSDAFAAYLKKTVPEGKEAPDYIAQTEEKLLEIVKILVMKESKDEQ